MSNASAAYPLSYAEAHERAAMLKRLGVNFARPDAEIIPLVHEVRKRRPLGLAPVIDNDDRASQSRSPHVDLELDGPPPRDPADNRAAWLSDLDVHGFATGQVIAEKLNGLELWAKRKLDEAQTRFENQIAALKNENTALRLILENLRIRERGDDGDRGPPGRDGRDGVNGAQGPAGPKGSRGQRGFETTGWLVDEAEYCITPLYYDNSQGPTLNLRGLFAQFQRDTEGDDVAFATKQAALSRASVELETERVRRGLPAK